MCNSLEGAPLISLGVQTRVLQSEKRTLALGHPLSLRNWDL